MVVGLVVIAIISAIWIRHQTLEHRLNIMEFMAEETVHRMVNIEEHRVPPEAELHRVLRESGRYMDMDSQPFMYIVNTKGNVLFSNLPRSPLEQQIHPAIVNSEEDIQSMTIEESGEAIYIVKKPIVAEDFLIGWVVLIETKANLTKVNQEYRQLSIMIIGLALLGWAAIYFLSKKLAKPITGVAQAAQQVKEGDYDIDLPEDVQEKEVYDLIHSFKDMSQKLKQLESLRTELLAGVTHELKTPVTSISGLLQALNDGVVEEEEAKEFLEISLKETAKMKKMVEDLLAFNTFAANAIPVTTEPHAIDKVLQDFIRQWEVVHEEEAIQISLSLLNEPIQVRVDLIRLQQMMTNLLTNATHAMDGEGTIDITLGKTQHNVTIDVSDNGIGIPEEDQPFIFERFYRGDNKKFEIGGLGLGLPFSKMVAQSLGGDLTLKDSTSSGTTFRITLPIAEYEDD
nr:ATP-binding protein [Caldalkalibacillus salinus]